MHRDGNVFSYVWCASDSRSFSLKLNFVLPFCRLLQSILQTLVTSSLFSLWSIISVHLRRCWNQPDRSAQLGFFRVLPTGACGSTLFFLRSSAKLFNIFQSWERRQQDGEYDSVSISSSLVRGGKRAASETGNYLISTLVFLVHWQSVQNGKLLAEAWPARALPCWRIFDGSIKC